MATSFIDRAQRGYNFLASEEGKRLGFDVNLLNPDTLELSDACGCALGQTFLGGHYWDAAERLADEGYLIVTIDDAAYLDDQCLTYLWERMHGFMLTTADGGNGPQEYAALTDAWREVIKRERDR